MTAFTSRSAESYDPKPWRDIVGDERFPWEVDYSRYDPRPEFEPTRDEFPFEFDGNRYSIPEGGVAWIESDEFGESHPTEVGGPLEWDPRDRNRNRILIAFRKMRDGRSVPTLAEHAIYFLASVNDMGHAMGLPPVEIEHTREVLTRLANFKKED